MPLTNTAVVAGKLLGVAFAAGLNLYATVAIIGLAARLELIAPLPPGLLGLSHSLVIGLAALLFLLELVIEKLPFVGAAWTAAHTIVRPLAAGLLAYLAFPAQHELLRIAIAAAVACVAFAAHGAQSGLRIAIVSARHRRSALYTASAALLLDLLAIALAIAALLHPDVALAVLAAAALALLLVGPRLWRAAVFGARALIARLIGFFGRRDWKPRHRLPRRIRAVIPPPPLGTAEPRGTRAAALGLPGTGAWRNGWLVLDRDGPHFVFGLFRPRRLPLPASACFELRPGTIFDSFRATFDVGTFTLFLLKDGPSMDHILAALTHQPRASPRGSSS